MQEFLLNSWICWRTYSVENDCRTLILNQKNSEFLLLESVSAELWQFWINTSATTLQLTEQFNCELDDIVYFFESLQQAGIVSNKGPSHEETQFLMLDSIDTTNITAETPSLNLEKEMMKWVEKNGFIYAAHWEITYRCNELCVHCYNPGAAHTEHEKPSRETDELNTEEAKKLLDQLAELGVFRLTLSGGEPTLRKDFIEILQYARKLGFQVVIYTNGLKMSNLVKDTIANLYPWVIEFSIYSAVPEEHDAVTRVPGSYQKTMNSLAYFKSRGIHTVFKASLTKNTINNWDNTLKLGEEMANTVILNTMISPTVDGKTAPYNAAADFGQLVILAATPWSPIYVGGEKENWGRSALPSGSQKPCGAGHGSIAITPEGVLYPCISFPMTIGEFRQNGLSKLRKSKRTIETPPSDFTHLKAEDLLAAWKNVRMEHLTDCGKHERCHYCGDICPGDAYVQTQDPLKAADNHCRQAYARMTAGKSLQAGQTLTDLRQKFGITSESGIAKLAKPVIMLQSIP